jgi:PilZ domain
LAVESSVFRLGGNEAVPVRFGSSFSIQRKNALARGIMMAEERRRSSRKRSFLRGCIYFNKRRGAIDCLIRDISDDGARIIFSDTVNVPEFVDLYIPQKEQTVRAHLQWRHGDEIGLSFVDPAQGLDGASGDLAQRVAHLESEVAVLRRLLNRLKSELPGGADAETV